jgi:hypothetical protein
VIEPTVGTYYYCIFIGIYVGFIGIYRDLYGIYGDLMGFMGIYRDIYGIYMGFIWDIYGNLPSGND